ncbi:contractile injection system protein, VgrG/Pvc8 family [Achromobacter animicus]|uniref:contractile injection system protein, VgrG/Pvc8 family n=1 Tax=Achromobacter animicus TaxID=1389935 RepID=UPI001FE4C98A|nr:contractile injection system protein, VgrG/Pvc8 family [Achromobacter animicus]
MRVHCDALFAAGAFFIGGPGRVLAVGWVCRCGEHVIPIQSDLRFTFAIGDESFEVIEFTLQEGLSDTFLLEVDLAIANSAIDFGVVLDRAALLTIWHGSKPVRYVHGAVSSFVQGDTGFRRTRYSAIVEPRLARLKLSSDWRIFQSQSVPQIAEAVLKAHGLNQDYEQRSTTEHQAREYCVQAGDTDYHFVERIMREETLYRSRFDQAVSHASYSIGRVMLGGACGRPAHVPYGGPASGAA